MVTNSLTASIGHNHSCYRNERQELEARKEYYEELNNNEYWINLGEMIGKFVKFKPGLGNYNSRAAYRSLTNKASKVKNL